MKRFFLFFLLSLLALSVWAGDIKTAQDLIAFAKACNGGGALDAWRGEDGAYHITADLDLSKAKKLEQIKLFGGVLDGEGHRITGWKCKNGLIAETLPGSEVKRIIIDKSCVMKASGRSGEDARGFIADINAGRIEACENYGTLNYSSSGASAPFYVGGLVGVNRYVILSCKNGGRVSVECSAMARGETNAAQVGGIFGGAAGKIEAAAFVAWCENTGEVYYRGDADVARTGGIAGHPGRQSLKFCHNRGSVVSEGIAAESGEKGICQTGGIAGMSKGDLLCCDNHGKVHSKGLSKGNTGGICGVPHAENLLVDCVNYGEVQASNENTCMVGGISGQVSRAVHFCRCVHKGSVHFDGISPRERSCVGGIIGLAYSPKSSTGGPILRGCLSSGSIVSESGGNRFENHDQAIHTGGIIGRSDCAGKKRLRLVGCQFNGQMKASGGRSGKVAGAARDTEVRDVWSDDYAESTQAMDGGANAYGRVTTPAGEPIPGVVVTDGMQSVQTDGNGYYAMKSDLDTVRFIYLSVPADCKVPAKGGIPTIFRKVNRGEKAVLANFTLEKRPAVTDRFHLIMIGDPQMRNLGVDGSAEAYRDRVSPDANAFLKTLPGETYAINLGDLVYNWMKAYDDYVDMHPVIGCTVFNVIGNHDYDQNNLVDTGLGSVYFENYITPEHYSFNIGNIHFILVNTILYDRKTADSRYGAGLDDNALRWLESDLKFVPKDKIIYICSHAQLYKKYGNSPNGSFGRRNRHYKEYNALLTQYKYVYSWSGHYHTNNGYDYAGKGQGPENVTAVTVARCNGTLRSNKFLDNDGTPNGYMVVDVDGDKLTWYYKTLGKERDYQMRGYGLDRTGDGFVKANIWNWSEGYWSTPEWYENGVKVADMENHAEPDPDYLELHKTLTELKGRAKTYAEPGNSRFMFRVKPSEGVRSGEIRVRDNFGVEYRTTVSW